MFETDYAEYVIRHWERDRARGLGESGESRMLPNPHPAEEWAVLSAAWRSWSWLRARVPSPNPN
jgi:hypothetical protein